MVIELEDMNPDETEWSDATKIPIDVVLLVVNDNEFRAAYAILPEPVLESDSETSLGMVYFGQIGKNKVALVRSSQGASGLTGIQTACLDSIMQLRPKTVICLGVCFGMDKNKQKLGDVLVSTKLGTYAPCRMNADGSRISRGVISECEPRLSKLFVGGKVGWKSPRGEECKPKVKDGLIISGPELIDCKDRKEELRKLYPDAIGGEMEGEGK